MRNKIFIVFTILMFSELFASGGSVYTRYGLGDLYLYNSARKLSLGGIGTAILDNEIVNLNNPATWSAMDNTKFGASMLSNFSIISDENFNASYSQVKFTGFHLGLPVQRDYGIGFVIGIIPFSTINYDVQNSYTSGQVNNYQQDFIGSGGLSKAFFGFSYILPLDISIGATLDYYTGNAKYQTTIIYDGTSDFSNSNFTSEFKYKGLGTTLGLLTPNLASIFNSDRINNVRLGVSYEISGKLNTDSSGIATTAIGETVFEAQSFYTKMPKKLSIGLNFNFDKLIVNLDYVNQPWSKYRQNEKPSSYLSDLNRYSIGVEFDPNSKKYGTFWELVKYRGGLSYEQSQYTIKGLKVNQVGIHTGMSFPLGLENTIDVGLMYGIRGTTENNLLKEKIFQASFTINLGELWFIRPDR
ncbi:MAG: hypothetical protein KDC90_14730 [Ignavibacteriae bacterium]|nr:hypothetical protein [Ignavibacteriota bacterium]